MWSIERCVCEAVHCAVYIVHVRANCFTVQIRWYTLNNVWIPLALGIFSSISSPVSNIHFFFLQSAVRNNRLCRLWKCSTGSITIIIRCVFRNAVYVEEYSTMQHYRSEKPYGSDNVACPEYVNAECILCAHRNVIVWSMNVLNIIGSIWFDPCFTVM